MLVEFKFSNFRSFKSEVVFSMEPVSLNGNNYNVVETNLKKIPQIYRSSGIFGANASGKSNLFKALFVFQKIIKSSHKADLDKELFVDSYALSAKNSNEPTFFEISFVVEGVFYRYGFKYNKKEVLEESLYQSDISESGTAREKRIFIRNGKNVEKSAGIKQSWIDELASNRLFLSELINLRSCKLDNILAVYSYLVNNIKITENTTSRGISFDMIKEGKGQGVLNLVKKADLGLDDIFVKNVDKEEVAKMMAEVSESDNKVKKAFLEMIFSDNEDVYDIKSSHIAEDGKKKEFDFDDMESKGTKVFLAIIGPVVKALEKGAALFVDEIDASLHPLLIKHLVSIFNSSDSNPNNAQLIFTSHAHYLMDGDYLTRDQIWFTSKENNNGFSSELYSLSDFDENRKKKSFYESYMYGVYGALPKIKEL
ncbi:MAG: ATP-binding protein [Alphaproteobacteria bacterium]